MSAERGSETFGCAAFDAIALGELIGHVGDAGFGRAILQYLNGVYDVGHVLIYSLTEERPLQIIGASASGGERLARASQDFFKHYRQLDPLQPVINSAAAGDTPRLIRAAAEAMPHRRLFDIMYGPGAVTERLILSGRAGAQRLAVSLIRPASYGPLDPEKSAQMLAVSPMLLAMIDKHAKLVRRSAQAANALSSLSEIESAFAGSAAGVPAREAQVCARIVYGMSTAGIALDLGVGAETVATYRKRAYQRLGVSGRHELIRWYLQECRRQRSGEGAAHAT